MSGGVPDYNKTYWEVDVGGPGERRHKWSEYGLVWGRIKRVEGSGEGRADNMVTGETDPVRVVENCGSGTSFQWRRLFEVPVELHEGGVELGGSSTTNKGKVVNT